MQKKHPNFNPLKEDVLSSLIESGIPSEYWAKTAAMPDGE